MYRNMIIISLEVGICCVQFNPSDLTVAMLSAVHFRWGSCFAKSSLYLSQNGSHMDLTEELGGLTEIMN